ncbi:hypothetical protein [Absidia glauca]|uniref:Condensation domain-containing protein n=1 Tax=Absidia glauca TaxID=4829 RepID=A0A168PID7_ABSGL|nr:hypothetical protein [Absidia glauca]
MPSSPTLSNQRSFGLLEKYQLSKTLTNCYGSVTCSAELKHQLDRPNNDPEATLAFYLQHFHPAITRLVSRFPSLGLVVRDVNQADPYFVHTSSFPLNQIVSVLESSISLDEAIGSACDQEWVSVDDNESTLPLWRLQILTRPDALDRCTVILTAHHVILDGSSLTLFWDSLLQELNDITATTTTTNDNWLVTMDCLAPMTLASPMEARPTLPKPTLLDYGTLAGGLLKDALLPTKLRQLMGMMPLEGWEGDHAAIEAEPHKTRIKVRKIDNQSWQTLVQLAKKTYSVSPHAALHAAFLLAWAHVYPTHSTSVSTPINYRHLAQADKEMGNFVGAYEHFWTSDDLRHPPSSTAGASQFWQLAIYYHGTLQANKARSCIGAQFLGLLKYPKDYVGFWEDKRKKHRMGRTGGLEHSDLGRFDTTTKGAWHLDGLWFAQSAQTYSTALGLNSVTLGDSMYATFGWQDGSIDEANVTKVMDQFVDIIQNCGQ